MSVPPWKQALIERRKKQEEDQKKKQDEEKAHLASVPPWKRALMQKREKEKQQHTNEQEKKTPTVKRDESFIRRQQELAKERESHSRKPQPVHVQAPSSARSSGGWGMRATPPIGGTSTSPPISPTSPPSSSPSSSSGVFAYSVTSQPNSTAKTLPSTTSRARPATNETSTVQPISQDVNVPLWRQRSASTPHSSRVVSNVKKTYESASSDQNIPAWKKALLQRRKEKDFKTGGSSGAPTPATNASSASASKEPPHSLGRRASPREEVEEEVDGGAFSRPSHRIERTTHPTTPPTSPGGRFTPTHPAPSQHTSTHSGVDGTHKHTDSIVRTSSPTHVTETDRKQKSPTGATSFHWPPSQDDTMASSSADQRQSETHSGAPAKEERFSSSSAQPVRERNQPPATTAPVVGGARASSHHGGKPAPKRTAPPPPPSGKPQHQRTSPDQAVNPPQQTQVVQRNLTQQTQSARQVTSNNTPVADTNSQQVSKDTGPKTAPVYGLHGEWANVSEDDPKFKSLPMWKQALIKRRRADIAKRTGRTTSVDDIPHSNTGSAPKINEQVSHKNDYIQPKPSRVGRNNIIEESAKAPTWNQQMMEQRNETNQNIPSRNVTREPAKQTRPVGASVSTVGSNHVKDLLNRFSSSSNRASSSAPSRAAPHPPPSKPPPTSIPARPTSRPTHTGGGVPPTGSTHTKTYSWSLGEGTLSDEALSDDSSSEGDEAIVTNIDDLSSEEDDDDSGIGAKQDGADDSTGGVVLLKPPRLLSPRDSETEPPQRRRKSSILIDPQNRSQRTLRRVSFSDSELCRHHVYPLYDYRDYEDIEEEEEEEKGRNSSPSFTMEPSDEIDGGGGGGGGGGMSRGGGGGGLSQRIHPSLRSPEPNMDNYRYSQSSPTSSSLQNYKPSMLSSYSDTATQYLHGNYMSAMQDADTTAAASPADENINDGTVSTEFYASLSSDTAALLW